MLTFVRYWLPAIVTAAGVLVMVLGDFDEIALEGGAGIIGAGLSIWLMNVMFRIGLHGDDDRDQEDAARTFFDANGHWPDEPPPPPRTPRGRVAPLPGAAPDPAAAEPVPPVAATPPAPRRIPSDRGQMRPRRPG